eukprot:scaffold22593_cov145-Cylindrotheca_fusiformis.AAC.6
MPSPSVLVVLLATVCIFQWIRIASAYQFLRPQRGVSKRYRSIFKRSYRVLEDEEETVSPRSSAYNDGAIRRRLVSMKRRKKDNEKILVEDVDTFREAVLDQQNELRKVQIENYVKEHSDAILNHEVLKLLQHRYETYSTPGNRKDNATLALAMEGGGMRGCVSAGMAAAIASLGLTDSFDSIYGSSAGSVVGAYMISRQMCLDVYVDILPAAKKQFVCKRRLMRSIASNLADVMVAGMKRSSKRKEEKELLDAASEELTPSNETTATPGMNISFILDGILGEEHGLRPLEMKQFQENEKKQHLRIVASTVDGDGNMLSKVFGTRDFFDETTKQRQVNGNREGLFACLQASMTVPGATGPPVKLKASDSDTICPSFDAFCFEPIPYRSAIEEGATHVLALCTRPEGFKLTTKQGVYEQGVAPLYFRSHGLPKVAEFFEKGGQQFIYAEDLLTLEQGKLARSSSVPVPPPRIFHGINQTTKDRKDIENRHKDWKQGHLFPLKVPSSTPELSTLEQDKDAVLEAVQGGFAAAFDILAPVVGLDVGLSGTEVSKLVFPKKQPEEISDILPAVADDEVDEIEYILNTKVFVPGQDIPSFQWPAVSEGPPEAPKSKRKRLRKYLKYVVKKVRRQDTSSPVSDVVPPIVRATTTALAMNSLDGSASSSELSHALLTSLPGFNGDRAGFHHLSKGLRDHVRSHERIC